MNPCYETTNELLGGVWFILSKVFKMGQTSVRIDNIEKAVMKLESVCNAHHDDITKIKTVMVEKYPKSSSVFSMKSSPRKLNPTGEKLFAAINGEQFLKDNKESLFGYISAHSLPNANGADFPAGPHGPNCRSLLRVYMGLWKPSGACMDVENPQGQGRASRKVCAVKSMVANVSASGTLRLCTARNAWLILYSA